MDKLQIRMTRAQLEAVIAALVMAHMSYPSDPHAGEWEQTGSWLSHRYTKVWGLPPQMRATLEAARETQ